MKRWQTFLRRLGMAAGAAMIVAAGAGAAPGSTTVGVVSMALQTDPATSIALTYTSASGVANSALVTAQLLDSAGRPTTNGGAALQIMFDSGLGGQLNTPPGTSSQSLGLGSCTGPGPAGAGYTNPQTGAIQCELTMSQAGSVDLTASLGASANQIPELTLIPAATTITQVAAGAYQGLAVTSAGRVLGWGNNGLGELGDGNEVSTGTPVPAILPNGTDVTSLAAGGYFTLALTSQGTVLAWGDDGVGQLGNGEVDRLGLDLPTSVQLPSGTVVTQVAAGCNHALALTSTGAVWGWGTDSSGQLGNGKFTKVDDVPVQADTSAIPGRIVQIAAGCNHTLALTSDGAVFAWGTGHFGQLGDGSTTPEPLPVQVKIPSNLKIIQVSGGSFSSYALAAGTTNQVLAWGQGGVGQLGDGKTKNSTQYKKEDKKT
jgi:alpha-tubulin suppressor-like RCC1 family protein